jgi:hypothetical protein
MDAERIDLLTTDEEPGFALVDAVTGGVRLVVSIEGDGDYDVVLAQANARRLSDALHRAAANGGGD